MDLIPKPYVKGLFKFEDTRHSNIFLFQSETTTHVTDSEAGVVTDLTQRLESLVSPLS